MNIMLGNQSVSQIEKRLGIEFKEDIKELMEKTRQENASNIKKGCWHCYDIPFVLLCGDEGTAKNIYNYLKDMSIEFKEELEIAHY